MDENVKPEMLSKLNMKLLGLGLVVLIIIFYLLFSTMNTEVSSNETISNETEIVVNDSVTESFKLELPEYQTQVPENFSVNRSDSVISNVTIELPTIENVTIELNSSVNSSTEINIS